MNQFAIYSPAAIFALFNKMMYFHVGRHRARLMNLY